VPIIIEPVLTTSPVPAQDIDLPHFDAVFTFDSKGHALVVQQGTVEEVSACINNIASCPKGFRTDLPDFGIDDPTFKPLPVNTSVLGAALTKYEPRARLAIEAHAADPSQPQNQTVNIFVEIA